MEKTKKIIDKCLRALQKAPATTSSRLTKLFRKLFDFLKKNPDYAPKTLSILFRLHKSIHEGNYAEVFEQLYLLLVLIGLHRKE